MDICVYTVYACRREWEKKFNSLCLRFLPRHEWHMWMALGFYGNQGITSFKHWTSDLQ